MGCRPRFACLVASPLARACTPLTKPEEKERLLVVYPICKDRDVERRYRPKIEPAACNDTATKPLRMRQVEHFRSLFPSHFLGRSRSASFLCAARGSVVLLHTARVFDYFVVYG